MEVEEDITSQTDKESISSGHNSNEDKLKEAVIKLFHSKFTSESSSLYSNKLNIILHRLPSFYKALRTTPTHPPYAVMVMEAIKDLGEEGGSSTKSISLYIRNKFQGLPFAHSHLLQHHLDKLVKMGEIVFTSNSCYQLLDSNSPNPRHESESEPEEQNLKKRGRGMGPREDMIEEKSVSRNEIVGSFCDGGVSSKKSKPNVFRLSRNENGHYIVLQNSNSQVCEESIVEKTVVVGSSADNCDGSTVLGNRNEHNPQEDLLARREMIQSLSDKDDCPMISANSNEHEADGLIARAETSETFCNVDNSKFSVEGKGSDTQLPSISRKECNLEPLGLLESEENSRTVEYEVESVQKKLLETTHTKKGDVEEVDQLESEVLRDHIQHLKLQRKGLKKVRFAQPCGPDDNPTIPVEVEPSLREIRRMNRAKKTNLQSCAENCEPTRDQLPDPTPATNDHHEEVKQLGSEENSSKVEIDVNHDQQLKHGREGLRKRKSALPCRVDDNPSVAVEPSPRQTRRMNRAKSSDPQSCADENVGVFVSRNFNDPKTLTEADSAEKQLPDTTPVMNNDLEEVRPLESEENNLNVEVEMDQNQQLKNRRMTRAMKHQLEHANQQQTLDSHLNVEESVGIRVGNLEQQDQYFKNSETVEVEKSAAIQMSSDGDEHLRLVDGSNNLPSVTEVKPLQKPPQRITRAMKRDSQHLNRQESTEQHNPNLVVIGIPVVAVLQEQAKRRGRPPKTLEHEQAQESEPPVEIEMPKIQKDSKGRGRPPRNPRTTTPVEETQTEKRCTDYVTEDEMEIPLDKNLKPEMDMSKNRLQQQQKKSVDLKKAGTKFPRQGRPPKAKPKTTKN